MLKAKSKLLSTVVAGLMSAALAAQAVAEVAEGTILNKSNIDQLKNETFDGHKISDLLTGMMEMQIREYNLEMKLKKHAPVKLNQNWIDADKKYGGKAQLDPATKMITGHEGGVPFHNVSADDPDAAWKLAWNQYYAHPVIGDTWAGYAAIKVIDAEKGIVDEFDGANARNRADSRRVGPPKLGKESDSYKYLLVLTKPYDVAGLGVFNKQYDDGKLDDGWVYIKSIRRTRRTAGGKSWMDPQPKMDLLNDDNQGSLGLPTWFKSWELVEKRWVLAVVDAASPNAPHEIGDMVDLDNAPYWNPKPSAHEWSPREVWVIKTTMPDEHPYGHRVLYQDVNFPTYYYTENYDKKGDLWRMWRQSYVQEEINGENELVFNVTHAVDFQRKRATWIDITYMKNNVLSDDFFKPSALKISAAGKLMDELK
jgi:hypothetical protein